MKIYELSPMGNDRAKSYYGKARVVEKDNGEKVLISYNTGVCKITKSGELVRLWGGYSATTMRHVNSFLLLFDIAGGGKAWWDTLTIN
jgi:N12 class adenine-specific DNA methylase